jgi:hypothetical protein
MKSNTPYHIKKLAAGQITMIHHDYLRKRRRAEQGAMWLRRGLELLYVASSLVLLLYNMG